jgi:integrase
MVFTSARKQGFITHNPAEAVEMLREDSEPAKQPFTIEQIKALLRNAHGDWRGAIMVALYTGMRMKDVANLRWENVDLPSKWVSFKAGKTRQRIKIPMHDALHDCLLELPAPDSGKAFLFPSLAGKSTGGKSGLSMAFSRLMERAKVRGEIVRERQGESGRGCSWLLVAVAETPCRT